MGQFETFHRREYRHRQFNINLEAKEPFTILQASNRESIYHTYFKNQNDFWQFFVLAKIENWRLKDKTKCVNVTLFIISSIWSFLSSFWHLRCHTQPKHLTRHIVPNFRPSYHPWKTGLMFLIKFLYIMQGKQEVSDWSSKVLPAWVTHPLTSLLDKNNSSVCSPYCRREWQKP